jgi:hypothetical protein
MLLRFPNRSRDRLKIPYWDHEDLTIPDERLERGSFQFPTDPTSFSEVTGCQITSEELSLQLDIDLGRVQRRPRFALPAKLPKTGG